MESKTEANLAKVVSTQGSTSQADGSDSDSSVFSLSVTTPTVDYSDNAEWILETGATYHVCPNRAWFSSFEKLDDVTRSVSYTHLRAHETGRNLVCRLLLWLIIRRGERKDSLLRQAHQ